MSMATIRSMRDFGNRRALRSLLAIVVLSLATPSHAQQYSDAQKEEARQATHYFKQLYWDCLAKFTPKAVQKNMAAADFKALLAGVCMAEKQNFRVPFVDFLAMEHPDIAGEEHFRQFDYIVTQAIDAEVARMLTARME